MEHASELLPYLMTVIGFLIVYVLNGIKTELKEVKTTVKAVEADMRNGLTGLDRRVTKIEACCTVHHDRKDD